MQAGDSDEIMALLDIAPLRNPTTVESQQIISPLSV
jgi:hypothetical protein